MAKGTKGGSVYVELALDISQFQEDFKKASQQVAINQKLLSQEMQRNKIRFEMEGLDQSRTDKLLSNTFIGRIAEARRQTTFLNEQIGSQRLKVNAAMTAWQGAIASQGALSYAANQANQQLMNQQGRLIALKKELNGTASASSVMASTMRTTALAAAAAVVAISTAYATAVKSAVAWGQAVNDIVDETGMADQEASKLLGTMNIVGLSSEEAAGALAKLAKNVNAAAIAQQAASKSGKESEDVFTKYGISITRADGSLLGHSEIISNIMEAHRNMKDGLEKTAMEMDIFGKTGYKMNDFLNLTQKQMDQFAAKLDKMGLVISDSQKYEDFNRKLKEMELGFKGIAVRITDDAIPAITNLMDKISEFTQWQKDNKQGLEEVSGIFGAYAKNVGLQLTQDLRIAMAAWKEVVEWRQRMAAQDARLKREEMGSSNLAELRKLDDTNTPLKKTEAISAAAKKAAKEQREAVENLNTAILTLQGNTLAATLRNIEIEKKAWLEKTKSEVEATKWAEAAKTKAFQDAMDARLGPEVAAAKKAILEGTNVGDAIYKASQQRRDEERATYDARQLVKKFYGIAEPGDEIKTLQVDRLNNTITQLTEVARTLTIPKDRYGRTVFDQYQPPPNQQMYTDANGNRTNGIPQGQPGSIFLTVPVSIDGQQVGQAAAKVILPAVQNAVGGNPTAFGGNQ